MTRDPRRRHPVLTYVGLVVVLVVAARVFVVQSFVVPTESMQPILQPGDRIVVSRLHRGPSIQRGDVVVFDGEAAFAAAPTETRSWLGNVLAAMASLVGGGQGSDYAKRVVGLPGDRVSCCDAAGRVTVNGRGIVEPYLYPGDVPSELRFDVVVPAGRIWVMGDHRSRSSDSRARLGRPGGGMVALDDVVGRVWVRYWPPDRWGQVPGAETLSTAPDNSGAGR